MLRLPWSPILLLACASPVQDRSGDEPTIPWPVAPRLEVASGVAGALPPGVGAEPAGSGLWKVTFSLPSDLRASEVALVGSFNGWDPGVSPMGRDADGRWRATVELGGGVHSYKFVLDGQRWLPDPENEDTEPDGFQGVNSLLRLGALGRPGELRAERGDGEIVVAALEHEPGRTLYLQRSAAGELLVRMRTLEEDVEAAEVVLRDGAREPMRVVSRSSPFEWWEARLAPPDRPLTYGIVLRDGALEATLPADHEVDPSALERFTTPEWTKHAIWYQVLVDRFRNGDPENDPHPVRAWTSAWNAPAPWEGRDGQTFYEYYVFQRMYGGDLEGLRGKLDHLQELGVTALYLNPIFQAPGHHKYNATDYRHVDTGYGAGEDRSEATRGEDLLDPGTWTFTPSDRLFLAFLAECKERGLRVVLDGVFNHVGVEHPAFQDLLENGRSSRYADWFEVRRWDPFEYVGWAGFGELPVFAKAPSGFASRAVEEHIFAVTRRWMDPDGDGDPSDGIDGWRLDVPMELPMAFWEKWRTLVKSINPDAFLVGEVWDQAEAWLDGKRFDAVMNYRFADAVVAWIGNVERKITATELDGRLARLRLAYPAEATSSLMDLLDSHDTDRFVSMMLNPDRAYDSGNREQAPGSRYQARRPDPIHYRRLRLAVLLQMTYVGAPMVYYGDEVGMWGSDDPNNRKPMLWDDLGPYDLAEDRVDGELLEYYRAAIALRRAHGALRVGSLTTLLTDDEQDLWVFERRLGPERLLVALTARDEDAAFELPGDATWQVLLGGDGVESGSARVSGISGKVWRAR